MVSRAESGGGWQVMADEQLSRIEKKLDEVLHTLNGNGTPGIKTRVALLETAQAEQAKGRWMLLTAVTSGIVSMFVVVGKWVWEVLATRAM